MNLFKRRGGGGSVWQKIIELILKEIAKWLTQHVIRVIRYLLKIVWLWLKRMFRRR
jgi:hypothetical protein